MQRGRYAATTNPVRPGHYPQRMDTALICLVGLGVPLLYLGYNNYRADLKRRIELLRQDDTE